MEARISEHFEKREPKSRSKWWQIVGFIAVILVIILLGGIIFLVSTNASIISPLLTKNNVVDPLDGTLVDKASAERHPLAIIIENYPDARPQAGLDKASIVYEAIAEGGITRFMAIFGPSQASKAGPVRSARTYFIDWLSEYNAYFAHVGGNLDALDQIKADNINDLDQFSPGNAAYWRVPKNGIAIEHTMFTATDLLYKAAKKKGYESITKFTALKFRDSKTPAITSQNITINFSEPQYKVDWTFDAATDSYLRTLGNSPHRDQVTGSQLSAKNIIIQEVERQSVLTAANEDGWAMRTIGVGQAKIFIEGQEIDGTWRKISRTDRTIFYDNGGSEIKFIPGAFWYEITPPEVFSQVKVTN